VVQDLLKDGEESRFFRGNLHCHSNRSDCLLEPEDAVCPYRDAGYDFICLADHFEA
jgi:predicted metal-dependent phosphoesterase TrpH